MKQLILTFITFLIASTAIAQSGQAIKYREKTVTTQDFDGSVYVYDDSTHRDFYGQTDKSADVQNLRWNEINNDWEQYYRTYYTYNADGNVTQLVILQWSAPLFDSVARQLYTYDAAGNNTEMINQSFDGANWINTYRTEWTYNATNQPTQYNYQTWDAGAWLNNDRYNYTYDGSGNLSTSTELKWNGAWENYFREIFLYNANNLMIQRDYQDWVGGAWEGNTRFLFNHDANGNVLVETVLDYDPVPATFDTLYRNVKTYDANSNLLTIMQQFASGPGVYTNQYRQIFTYNAISIEHTRLNQTWDQNTWVNNVFDSTTFDANNQKKMTERVRWVNSTWVPDYKWHYQYEAYDDETGIAAMGPDLNWQGLLLVSIGLSTSRWYWWLPIWQGNASTPKP